MLVITNVLSESQRKEGRFANVAENANFVHKI